MGFRASKMGKYAPVLIELDRDWRVVILDIQDLTERGSDSRIARTAETKV